MRSLAGLTLCVALFAAPLAAGPHEALWAKYQKGDLTQVVAEVRTALATSADDAELHLLLGRALVGLQQFEEARTPLRRAVALDTTHGWPSAWALTFLARAEYGSGAPEAARDALLKAIALDATPNATKDARQLYRVLGFDPAFDAWPRRESEHFVFRFAPSLPPDRFDAYVEAHEQAFDTITTFFGAAPPRKITFFVWGDPETEKLKVKLGFALPEMTVVHAHAKQTVGHEMTHVITHWAVRPVKETGLINEGVAVSFDQTRRDRIALARAALEQAGRTTVSVEQLWTNWVNDDTAYPIAGAFVRHLITNGGRDRFLQLLRNQTYENARAVYGDELAKLVRSFELELVSPAPAP